MRWLADEHGMRFDSYDDLWQWSVDRLPDFWASIWEFFHVQSSRSFTRPLVDRAMPGAKWFPGSRLNYAEQIFHAEQTDCPAILFQSERHPLTDMSWTELRRQTGAVAAVLRGMGVQPGDRVVGYIPNIPEAVIALLACASIGAVWSSCSPDFGTDSVVDRFKQIEPTVLFAVDGYQYDGKPFDRRAELAEIRRSLPSLRHTVLIPYLDPETNVAVLDATLWADVIENTHELVFEQVPFDHPLWVLFSSGTTGLPKPIVQGHGGITLEHLKVLSLHHDIKPGDRFFWFSTTGWMMWNLLVGGLLLGSTIVLYDGSPAYPSIDVLWDLAESSQMTYMGASASYVSGCMKAGIDPRSEHDLSALVGFGSTGSPLSPEGFLWVYQRVKPDIWLGSMSGGTDVCTAFVGSNPLLPVRAGELQCRCLGADVQAYDPQGQPVIGQVGELVVSEPMPSMPLFFWNDVDGRRYRDSYFATYTGIWCHGDWIKITPEGGVVIYGRSDSTLNRGGVRMGSAEIYAAVEDVPEVQDSLIVGLERPNNGYFMPLFVVLDNGQTLDENLRAKIRDSIRRKLSPRHVPDQIYVVPSIPRTLSGKKLEVPVKRILMGARVDEAANPGAMANPAAMAFFVDLAETLG